MGNRGIEDLNLHDFGISFRLPVSGFSKDVPHQIRWNSSAWNNECTKQHDKMLLRKDPKSGRSGFPCACSITDSSWARLFDLCRRKQNQSAPASDSPLQRIEQRASGAAQWRGSIRPRNVSSMYCNHHGNFCLWSQLISIRALWHVSVGAHATKDPMIILKCIRLRVIQRRTERNAKLWKGDTKSIKK